MNEIRFLLDPSADRSVGLIVPPSNPTAEVEIRALVGQTHCVYTARLPNCLDMELSQRNESYLKSYHHTIRQFGNLPLQGILIALTGAQYELGLQGDRELCRQLSDDLEVNVCTASLAIAKMLDAWKITTLQLILSYPDWLAEHCVNYWRGGGFDVTRIHRIAADPTQSAYRVKTQQVSDLLDTLHTSDGSLILISGTGMVSVEAISELPIESNLRVLSSNLCGARWLADRCPLYARSTMLDAAFARLEADGSPDPSVNL